MYHNIVFIILPSRIHVCIFKFSKSYKKINSKKKNEQIKIDPSEISQLHAFYFRSLQFGRNLTHGHGSKIDLITFCVFDSNTSILLHERTEKVSIMLMEIPVSWSASWLLSPSS